MEYMKNLLFQNRNLREEERWAGVYHWVCSCSPRAWGKEDPHGCRKSEATADQSTQVLRESLKMVSSKEVRSSGMGSTCEMSAEMSLILIPCLLLNYPGSVGAQVFLLAVGAPG